MRLNWHPDGCEECPLVVITALVGGEARILRQAIDDLAGGNRSSVDLGESFAVEGEVRLVLTVAEVDRGIANRPPALVCALTPETWAEVRDLLDGFLAAGGDRYQWLDESGEVTLLISTDGRW
jgi:hypothetical protein